MYARMFSICMFVLASAQLLRAEAPPNSCDPRENFKWLISQPEVGERLSALMNETVDSNQGKTKDEIGALFEQKKKEYGATLKREAKQRVPLSCPKPQ